MDGSRSNGSEQCFGCDVVIALENLQVIFTKLCLPAVPVASISQSSTRRMQMPMASFNFLASFGGNFLCRGN